MIPTPPTIQMVRKTDLAIHATVKRLPLDRGVIARISEELEGGADINDPLDINEAEEVIDGRHRLFAALTVKRITHVPCVVRAADGMEATHVIKKRAQRCHWTKSALAYALLPEFEMAVAEAVARRSATLKRGTELPITDHSALRGQKGSDEIAVKYGVSVDMLQLARHTAKLFTDSDKIIAKWLFANESERNLWGNFGRDLESPWTKWRTERLVDMGENPRDPTTATLIPEDYREIYEEQLFAGEMGLGQINKALGSILATKGKTRGDLKDDDAQSGLHLTLCNKLVSFNKTMWRSWSELPVAGRAEVVNELTAGLAAWPQEAKLATYARLKDELKK